MNKADFDEKAFDERAIKISKAYKAAAEKYYSEFENDDFSTSDIDYFQSCTPDWFEEKSDELLGKTPKDYITDEFGDTFDFETAISIIKPFLFDEQYNVPRELCETVNKYPEFCEWAKAYISLLIDNCDDEKLISSCDSFFSMVFSIEDDEFIDMEMKLFDLIDAEKYPAPSETVALALSLCEKGIELISKKVQEEEPDDKIYSLISSASVSLIKTDELYKAIRSFCKKAPERFLPDCYFLFSSYGDGRAVSFLRTQAKKYRDLWYSGENAKENQEAYYILLNIISKLGGNTEDFD